MRIAEVLAEKHGRSGSLQLTFELDAEDMTAIQPFVDAVKRLIGHARVTIQISELGAGARPLSLPVHREKP